MQTIQLILGILIELAILYPIFRWLCNLMTRWELRDIPCPYCQNTLHVHCLDFGLNPIRKCDTCDDFFGYEDFNRYSNVLRYQLPVIPR